jgi:DNA-directed RNA polymerase subunit RPC12/RpoP
MPGVTTPTTYVCAICGVVLKRQAELDKHLCLLHDDCGGDRIGPPITFRCATCGQSFARRGDLFAHLRQNGHGSPPEWDASPSRGAQRPRARRRGRDA